MPRKKPVDPPPLESIIVYDGIEKILFEVRDHTCELVIGRGIHKKNAHDRWLSEVLEWLAETYIYPHYTEGELLPDLPVLSSPTIFSRALQQTHIYPPDGPSDSHVRTRLYQEVLKEIQILSSAIAAKSTS